MLFFSETESEKNVYLLKYGLDLVDDEAERVWRDLGYNVKWVESSLAPFLTGGGLRCMTNILELEEVHIESFDESEDVSAVESMSVMGWYDEFGLSGISGFLQKNRLYVSHGSNIYKPIYIIKCSRWIEGRILRCGY